MIVAVLLRVYEVFRFPFEQDELYTIDEATNLFHTRLLPGIQARPFFFLLEHPFLKLAAPTEPFVRFLPLLFGVAGVWVTWRLARDLAGPVTGFVALTLVAISPWHLYVSGFGRYYSLLYLLAALVYWRLPMAYETDRPKVYLGVLAALFIGAWTHPSFVFPIIGAALAVSIFQPDGSTRFRWPTRTAWLWLWGPFLGFSVIVAAIIRMIHHVTTVGNGGDRGVPAMLRLVPAMVDWMTVLVAASAVAGIVLMIRVRVRREAKVRLDGGPGMCLYSSCPRRTVVQHCDLRRLRSLSTAVADRCRCISGRVVGGAPQPGVCLGRLQRGGVDSGHRHPAIHSFTSFRRYAVRLQAGVE